MSEWESALIAVLDPQPTNPRHGKCMGEESWGDWGYEFDCGYPTKLECDECKYSGLPGARKDPEAKCNQL